MNVILQYMEPFNCVQKKEFHMCLIYTYKENLALKNTWFIAQSAGALHRLHLCGGVRPPPQESPRYDTKQSNGEVSRMWSTPSLPLFPGPLWPGMVAPDRTLSMG